jgi:chromosome partitioning protein
MPGEIEARDMAEQSTPLVVAFANLKGGVGKSTLAVNVAGALGASKRVILVDADPQGTATAWGEAGGLPFEVVAAPLTAAGVPAWLARIMALPAQIVVLDLPPMLGEATSAALAICDLVVIPVSPSGADLRATNKAVEMIQAARELRGGAPRALLVPSKVDRRTAAGAEIEAVLHGYGEPVGPIVAQRIAHSDAFTAGQWIGDYAPRSAALGEIRALGAVVARLLK